jgi:hypothetical protein
LTPQTRYGNSWEGITRNDYERDIIFVADRFDLEGLEHTHHGLCGKPRCWTTLHGGAAALENGIEIHKVWRIHLSLLLLMCFFLVTLMLLLFCFGGAELILVPNGRIFDSGVVAKKRYK